MAVELISSNILSIVASGLAGAAVTASVASVAPAIAVLQVGYCGNNCRMGCI